MGKDKGETIDDEEDAVELVVVVVVVVVAVVVEGKGGVRLEGSVVNAVGCAGGEDGGVERIGWGAVGESGDKGEGAKGNIGQDDGSKGQ